MNTPTPLGKTYEQYEKELKEFNLSKVEKVELGAAQDLKKYEGLLEKSMKEISETVKKSKEVRKSSQSLYQKIFLSFDKINAQIKELGIKDYNSIPNYMSVRKLLDAIQDEYVKLPK